ncbi:hypothetical protein OIY81_2359 [Cryptosporidium canis]|nr:hypothetical protein OIY81_2359 [Cryptosporidium canis]
MKGHSPGLHLRGGAGGTSVFRGDLRAWSSGLAKDPVVASLVSGQKPQEGQLQMEYIGSLDNPLRLIYFSCRGTCDVIRLLLVDQEIPYEEHNISGKDFLQPEFQQVLLESGNFPMLPYLSDSNNEVELTGSFTILRYLADKCKLMGSCQEERSRVENWLEFLQSMLHSLWDFENTSDSYTGVQRTKKRSQFLLETLHPMLKCIDDKLEQGVWALDSYSVIDIVLYSTISVVIRSWGSDLLKPYIRIISHKNNMEKLRKQIDSFKDDPRRF